MMGAGRVVAFPESRWESLVAWTRLFAVVGGIRDGLERCFGNVVLEKTLESPLDCKEIKSVNPKGNQS